MYKTFPGNNTPDEQSRKIAETTLKLNKVYDTLANANGKVGQVRDYLIENYKYKKVEVNSFELALSQYKHSLSHKDLLHSDYDNKILYLVRSSLFGNLISKYKGYLPIKTLADNHISKIKKYLVYKDLAPIYDNMNQLFNSFKSLDTLNELDNTELLLRIKQKLT